MTTSYLDNYYARLGVYKNASLEDIRAAYHQAAKRLHPDSNKNPGATELFLQVQEAYEVLSNKQKRVEYDRTLPDDLNPPPEIMINAVYSRRSLPRVDSPQLVYLLLDLMALPDPEEDNKRPPLNICLVLDTSTSMHGPRLEAVKATASSLIRSLQADDIFSLISFNDRAEVVVPAARGLDLGKVESRISILRTSGGTEMYPGLKAAMEQINQNLSHSYLNHIILVTDGRTYGDEAECLQVADSANQMGITITALGIGHEWNDEFLDELTRRTGGSCTYADHASKVKQILEEKIGEMSVSYANSLCLEYTTPSNVEMRYAFRLSPDPTSICAGEKICMGNLPSQQNLSILMEFFINGLDQNNTEQVLAEGTLHITIPNKLNPKISSRIRLSRPISDEPDTSPPPRVLIKAMSSLSLYRMQEQAQIELKAGKVDKASQHLDLLANQLLGSGQQDLAKTVRLELEKVKQGDPVSEEGKKRIKYGTRSLVMSDEVERLL